MTQQEIVASLPAHLRPFVRLQDYGQYSARDQAVWRFIMRQLTRRLGDSAHPVYLEGLARTGIALDHIPSVEEMNACLAELGWQAVVVDGFIPPAIFMEFQALKILVIALEMRSVDHIFYTPAPDIVHESAGHAPFIVDVDYAEFLQRFGEIGMKAIASHQDFAQYEAVRHLSIVKETADSTAADVAAAERALEEAMAVTEEPSEAALLTRLHWWTVEYGLVGELDNYRLFGAGLLSSLGESRNSLDDQRVKKLPLTVDAVHYPYDITRQQPQLFVTRSCHHLGQVLEEFAAAMCFQRGGAESLRKAIAAGTVCTARYDSGIQVSGQFVEVLCDAVGKAVYLRTSGPTQLAWRDTEIYGHGTSAHAEGFGSPVGKLKDLSRCLSEYSVDELRAHHIVIGEPVVLEFLSGITVRGRLQQVLRRDHRNLLLSFSDCTVTDLQGRLLFQPAWGQYDMAVGATIDSVYGGTADRERYQLYKAAPAAAPARTGGDVTLQGLYRQVAALAAGGGAAGLAAGLDAWPDEWLLRAELLEAGAGVDEALRQRALADLQRCAAAREDLQEVIGLVLETAP
ncbi:MAG: aromatic amino acid hydroxylase [Haliea sp.]|uniref:aromatic amino acid hydroxylase n=1 Tax=Haliea sp. TaxID=1932666 RepID=UPI0032EBFE46